MSRRPAAKRTGKQAAKADRVRQLFLLLLTVIVAFVAMSTARQHQPTAPVATPPEDVAWAIAPMSSRLPELRFVVTGPPALKEVSITENGVPVSDYTLKPAGAAKDARFGVVLAIDSSLSMGDSISGALTAARELASRRNDNQLMAVLFFDSETHVVQPLTADQDDLDFALSRVPKLSSGTRIYDAVSVAAELLKQSQVNAGTIVLLSDGDDVGSRATATAALANAERAQTRIFAVGLKSSDFSPTVLRELAQKSRGVYSEASSEADLQQVYARLGGQLAAEYVLSYPSRAHAGQLVDVRVAGPGGETRATYVTPLTTDDRANTSAGPLGLLLVVLFPGLIVFLAVFLLLRQRQQTPQTRIAAFLPESGLAVAEPEKEEAERDPLAAFLLHGNPLSRMRWWKALERDLELAQVKTPPGKIALAASGMFALSLILALTASPLWAGLAVLLPIGVRLTVKQKLARRRKLFAEQLPDTMQVLASALRAGHSLAGALQVVVEDAIEPSKSEYQRVLTDEKLGVSLDQALHHAARRLANEELEQVAVVAFLQHQTGGNIAEVLDRVVEAVRGRTELKRRVNALTAQGKMARWVVSLLPVGLGAMLTLLNPDYTAALYTTLAGQGILVFAATMIFLGSYIIKKIVEIEI